MGKKYPFFRQHDSFDCGPACLRMVAKYYGKNFSPEYLREQSHITRSGVSLLGISEAAETIGLRSLAVQIPYNLLTQAPLPCIVHWRQNHFVVVYEITAKKVVVADPAHGLLQYTLQEFRTGWTGAANDTDKPGVVLLLETTPDFFNNSQTGTANGNTQGLGSYLLGYLKPYRAFILQLFLGVVLGCVLQLIFPFLTQALVDRGIEFRDIGFVNLVLIAQLLLFGAQTATNFIQSWLLLHISSRINIALVSDFLRKLMRLPISFFETRITGDLLQRISDHSRIEHFLTTATINIAFSALNLLIFGLVLFVFSPRIFTVFLIGAVLYLLWVALFLNRRRNLDYKLFDRLAGNQNSLVQMILAMQDIKLNNCEQQKRWEWENIRAQVFNLNVQSLALYQYQQVGAFFINRLKDILISYIAAKSVIDGQITLGTMLAVQYIVGQVNSPLEQLIDFIGRAQDAKISFERLNMVRNKEEEDPDDVLKLTQLPDNKNLTLHNLSFRYGSNNSPMVLNNLSLQIPTGKVTAIVGSSGSGKTTLLKLLLKFYPPTQGQILIGNTPLSGFHSGWWRQQCGAVMQDGFIYSDTVARNIAPGAEYIDRQQLMQAVKIANLQEFVDQLPMGLQTKIGPEGLGISQGQKQRILIARAVYKNPQFLFFDEATSALDTENEKIIMQNLQQFFAGKTVVIVAHRLSTVKNADQIVMLYKGEIIEQGSHPQLVGLKQHYFHLIKNQLELGV
ncbi:peptidase domain-containing ABC transporter [Sphingobacteriales bacterium UPWRP_1]|nr:ABC transporter ATP-binding protein [Sphingobacteriales bacterium TSM_CSM]PSJ72998.1 peptidase domain-containing ABC transporter [Sphingobacteriales bacterium UPWRP_1]